MVLLFFSVAVIITATLLPFGGVESSAAPSIRWCLTCAPFWLADAVANILLFVPLGASLQMVFVKNDRSVSRTIELTAAMALSLSLVVETLQFLELPPGRSPALADVVMNGLGGLGGALSGVIVSRQHERQWAQVLAWCSASAATTVILITGYALSFPTMARITDGDVRLSPSRFGYSPGYGWYGGRVERVVYAGDTTTQKGEGPVVRALSNVSRALELEATLDRLDRARNVRAFVYVHGANDSLPLLMLAQHGDDALLVSARRGSRWGLYVPSHRVVGALCPLRTGVARSVTVRAQVDDGSLSLAIGRHGAPPIASERSLHFTPLLGWALLQSVITVDTTLALPFSIAWNIMLFFPVAYWGARVDRRTLSLGVATVVGSLVIVPIVTNVHFVSLTESGTIAAICACGVLLARIHTRALSQHIPRSARKDRFQV